MKRRFLPLTLLVMVVAAAAYAFGAASRTGDGPRYLNLPGRGDTRPFTHTIVSGGAIYLAGTIGLDPQTGRPPGDSKAEARMLMDGLKAKVELAGATMDDLVMVQIFCSDVSLYEEFNAIYAGYFEARFPTRSFIGSGPLLFGARYEINGIAVTP